MSDPLLKQWNVFKVDIYINTEDCFEPLNDLMYLFYKTILIHMLCLHKWGYVEHIVKTIFDSPSPLNRLMNAAYAFL